ncbi:NAD(P)/FAD-dependent oxidoreductase [Williamsia herbipolensis]|uniref:NAD(P)/FAD-dependent oxidoreductase n=1 Tax=Williamsia herbipolensis TaxID=1603258 RepID=UPI000696E05C|nr:FAD-dependent oxidoreductase [Williamsia herbipolensis]
MITVVGASLAGLTAARELRASGVTGTIAFVGAESWLPYDRPPLSKDVLLETFPNSAAVAHGAHPGPTALLLDGEAETFDWHLGVAADGLSVDAEGISVRRGQHHPVGPADAVILATGARGRTLIGADLDGVHVLRTLDDARALAADLRTARRVVMIGGGFIGAEIASTARTLGAEVAIIEATEIPGAAVLGVDVARWSMARHALAGVSMNTGAAVETIDGTEGRVRSVTLGDGRVLDADVVVVGIGSVPDTEWAAASGIALDDGFVTDAGGATSMPGVYAVGDCARTFDPITGTHVRRQHWSSAVDQARTVARRIAGLEPPPQRAPSFWSDQYGHRVQVCGHIPVGVEPQLVDGSMDPGATEGFLAVFGDRDRPAAVVAVDRPRDFLRLRKTMDRALTGSATSVAHA